MIKSFSVANFLSIKDKVTFSLEAGKEAGNPNAVFEFGESCLVKSVAIYGANASGKSNLLKAVAFLRVFVVNCLKTAGNPIPIVPFLLSDETDKKPSVFELEILSPSGRFIYSCEIDSKKIFKESLFHYAPKKRKVFERDGQAITFGPYYKEKVEQIKGQVREDVLLLSVLFSFNNEIAKTVVNEIKKIEVVLGAEKNQTLDYSFAQFKDNYSRERMMKMIKESDFGIVDMQIEEKMISTEDMAKTMPLELRSMLSQRSGLIAQRKLAALHKKNGKIEETVAFDFFQESDGTQQMFALSGPLVNSLKEGKTVFIDELDSHLHPFLCQYILSIFNSKENNPGSSQLIFTTHDISLLNSEIMRRDQIWFAEKNRDQGTSDYFSLYDMKEKEGMNYAKRYFEGRYGALPYVSALEGIESLEDIETESKKDGL